MSDSGSEHIAGNIRTQVSDEEGYYAATGSRSAAAQSRRGTRACDRCRKIKSRCESTEGEERCRNCIAAGTPCTFQGPSFKRGPPKGYIHAIEQRWHQVECILATIMASPRAQDIVTELRQDHLARTILDRVASGPYGAIGRTGQQPDASNEGLYNTIMTQSAQGLSEDRRSKRQSRLSREIVSSQDSTVSAPPTPEWQESLYRRLSATPVYHSPLTSYSTSSSDQARFPSWSSSSGRPSPVDTPRHVPTLSAEPSVRRRRIEEPGRIPSFVERSFAPTQDVGDSHDEEEYDETVDALGHLSVDKNQEFRYHGRSAGLHLLAQSDRTDDSRQKENGIWKFNNPQATETVADCHCLSFEQVNDMVELPDVATQDQLVTAYFTYVHHFFPVVHQASFLTVYCERNIQPSTSSHRREPMQTVTKLLLLAMFAFAERYIPALQRGSSTGDRRAAGKDYATDARRLLNTVYDDSRPSVCQALLLLGMREFGLGCHAQGWLWIGMACRMAIDLGMNRDSDGWKDAQGRDIFTPVEKQIRRQIWWSCCIADKMSAVWLGRTVMFRRGDFDVPVPELDLNEDQQPWKPFPRDALGPNFAPMAGLTMTTFRAQCRLSFIISEIMHKVYPIKWHIEQSRREILDQLESALHTWMIDLPDELRYHEVTNRPPAPPHVMFLHAEYYSALLLLYRAFLRVRDDHDPDMLAKDPVHAKCFDVCQGAAAKVSSIITMYHQTFGLQSGPPFMVMYLQTAGIMHIVTLTRQPRDTQATVGLMQCIHALEELQDVWPSAIQVHNLLKGAKVQMDDLSVLSETAGRPKRSAEEALSEDPPANMFVAQPYPQHLPPLQTMGASTSNLAVGGPYGLGSPSPGPPYVPGYEWWPQLVGPATGQAFPSDAMQYTGGPVSSYSGLSNSLFTFDPNHLSADFLQGVSSPGAGPSMPPQYPPHPGHPDMPPPPPGPPR